MRRPGPELSAVATVCFLFFKGIATGTSASAAQTAVQFNQRIMGGTLVSSLAGEYSFAFALTLALFALGALAFSVRTGRRKALAAALIAATVMSHVIVGIFLVVGALVILVAASTDRRVAVGRTIGRGAAIGGVAALLTAFWTVPLIATFGYTANMRYEKLTAYGSYLYVGEFLWVYLLAGVGLVLGIVARDRATIIVASIAAIFALVFRFWPELHAWNLRFLPFWYLGVFLLAALGAAEIVRRLSGEFARLWVGPPASPDAGYDADAVRTRRTYRFVTSMTIIASVVVLAIVGLWFNQTQQGFLGYWAEWNETGYENAARPADPNYKAAARKQYPEYRALLDRMAELPPGRALWEGGGSIDAYGTPLALMLLPYWTHGRIQSFEGLYYESAASTPYVFMAIAPLSGLGQRVEPGARARLPVDRELLRRRALSAGAGRSLLPRALAGGEGRGEPRSRAAARGHLARRRPPGPRGLEHLRGARPCARRAAGERAGRGRSARGDPARVLRGPGGDRSGAGARRLGMRRGRAGGRSRRISTARSPRPGPRRGAAPRPVPPPACPRSRCPRSRCARSTRPTTTSASTSPAPASRWWCAPRTSRTGRPTVRTVRGD